MVRGVLDSNGDISLRDLPPICVDTLVRVPSLLASDDPQVRGRMRPRVYESDEDEEQWRRFAVPELDHLFRAREEILRKDLATLDADGPFGFRLRIPARHVSAWLSSLTGARFVLFEQNAFSAEDLERDPFGAEGDEQLALFRIHNLAMLQELLLQVKQLPHAGEVSLGGDDDEATADETEDLDL